MKLQPVNPRAALPLSDRDAQKPKNAPPKDEIKEEIKEVVDRICELQRVLYADARYTLLVLLQGRDASGKDGTIKHVFKGVNPLGTQVTSFKAPTEDELRHDFLWRIHTRVPPRSMIGIFNRSHYEDVIVPRVHGTITRRVWTARYRAINDFERMLTENGVVILKFFLHISKSEQKQRLQERLEDPEKNWKYNPEDLETRSRWNVYTAAFRDAIRSCSTSWAPWYVVPADNERVRDLLVAKTIADTLDGLKLRYPRASAEIRSAKIR
jgi:PPK2 family polyphosphate:nucleotide phosphotransferase